MGFLLSQTGPVGLNTSLGKAWPPKALSAARRRAAEVQG